MAAGIDLGLSPDGSDIGDLKPVFPAVNLNRAVSEIAHETGLNLKNSGLYLYNDVLITVDSEGCEQTMEADRFRTWIDSYQINFYRRKKTDDEDSPGVPIKATMKKDVASVLLASDDFRGHIPVIEKILPVRLPVWDPVGDGTRRIRLLDYGYDQATRHFTQNTGIEYLELWTLDTAIAYLRKLLKGFPYGDDGRSMSVQVSAMLTMYCQLLFGKLDRFPMIYFNANQPGCGKSRQAEMCIYPIYGHADPLSYSDNDEFVKKLDAWSKVGLGYVFLDDVSGLVKSNDLNRWITSPMWSGRNMHTQTKFSVLNQKLTLVTGNQATLSGDLVRRSLMVDLWSSQLTQDRQAGFDMIIDAEWLSRPKNRGDILSAMFSLVQNWVAKHNAQDYPETLGSFEGWSRIIPAIVTRAGFACPLQDPAVQDAGGKQEVEFMRLIEAAVRDYDPQLGKPVDILLTDWCRLARHTGVFHNIVSDATTTREVLESTPRLWRKVLDADGVERPLNENDKLLQSLRYMDKGQSTKFGHQLNKFYRGQVRKIHGRTYKFSDRKAQYSTFSLELLSIDPAPPPPPERPDNEPF